MKNPKKILIPLAGALCLSATLTSAMAAAFPVTIHALSSSQREELEERGQVGTAYLAQNNETGTNGSLCAPFTARSTGAAFALASAPGAENYNVQLYTRSRVRQSSINLHRFSGGRRSALYRPSAGGKHTI